MPPKDAANWMADPEDIPNLLKFLHAQRSRCGEGGNWDKTVLNEAAAHMLKLGPPAKGGPKTANSIGNKWKDICKLHEYILQAKQKVYPGMSGWTYTDEHGFNVTDENRDALNDFSRAHPHFKLFATSGWAHFTIVDEIMPSRARGRFVFSAGFTQSIDPSLPPHSQSQDDDDGSSQLSQPLTDSWSQSNASKSQLPNLTDDLPAPPFSTTQPPASQATTIPATPTAIPALKRSLLDDGDSPSPWSSKRTRTTGPESILALSQLVTGVGKVIETVFAPPKSSAMSPTKKVAAARKMALQDMNNGYLMSDERTRLHILFGRDTTAANAYILDDDALLRADIGRELLNPTQNFNYN
ncbi:hypothetical protein B0H14DRAFT_3456293 [Mycena olivaceomarginata]|nr:hypothetical protein B0H14DRAFT_3456293 [Mycena olivaceomarginata]